MLLLGNVMPGDGISWQLRPSCDAQNGLNNVAQ
jgi:hypothetical protein